MTWHARLDLDYRVERGRTVVRHVHDGPLRVLQSLYPEGDAVCHNVLVHPPGGLVGGDTLAVGIDVAEGAHALVTTPGATRFYRSEGEAAVQDTRLRLAADARLEWLPLEALAYSGCQAENRLRIELAPGAECLGWDITALGLPEAHQPFERGQWLQHLEVPGIWLERGRIAADDTALLDGPLGLAGHRCLASLFFVSGTPIAPTRAEAALETAQALIDPHPLVASAGMTQPNPHVLVLRVLAPVVEPAMNLLRRVRGAWRALLWERPDVTPRIWTQ
jgi:urease accessory protein